MKKITIKNGPLSTHFTVEKKDGVDIHEQIVIEGPEEIEVSDGYHTFTELYEHRIILFIALCKVYTLIDNFSNRVWRSKYHSDGSNFEGWFILGINKRKREQITYHLPNGRWSQTNFAETLKYAPEWDGHSSQDVLDRLKNL